MVSQRFFRESFDPRGRLSTFTLDWPDHFNYGYDVMDRLAEESPEKRAILWRNEHGDEVILTLGDLSRKSNQAANVLRSCGVKKGDVVMVSLRTHYQYWYIALACHKLGVLLCPVFHRLLPEDLAYRIGKARPAAVICTAEGTTARHYLQASESCPIPLLFTVQGRQEGFRDFDAEVESASDTLERVDTRPEEPILLYFTSGSTGEPKAVIHDHLYTLSHTISAKYMLGVTDGGLHFANGDTGWEVVSGTKFYGPLLCGSAIFLYDTERFSPKHLLEQMAQVRLTSFMAQPTVYRQLTAVGMDRFDLSSVTNYAVGGERLTQDVDDAVFRQTGQHLWEGYAQSEAGLIAANTKNMGRKPGSVGKILPKYHVELLKDDGTFAGPGEHGEVVIVADGGKHPPGLLAGYFDDPDATALIWDHNLYHTGDLAWKDEEDFLYYLGRVDGIIKVKGYRVSPFEIEESLQRHPAVYECIAVGVPDPEQGQRVKAYIRLMLGYMPSGALAREIMEFHNADCTFYKKVREVEFVPDFQRNDNGKILRRAYEETPAGRD